MDWSPILISMKTASLSIFITFFIGLFAAWAVVSLKNETLKVICDGILTLPLVFHFSGLPLPRLQTAR
jgi:molybdate transport system permease protein